jgi:hypothetical protein
VCEGWKEKSVKKNGNKRKQKRRETISFTGKRLMLLSWNVKARREFLAGLIHSTFQSRSKRKKIM